MRRGSPLRPRELFSRPDNITLKLPLIHISPVGAGAPDNYQILILAFLYDFTIMDERRYDADLGAYGNKSA